MVNEVKNNGPPGTTATGVSLVGRVRMVKVWYVGSFVLVCVSARRNINPHPKCHTKQQQQQKLCLLLSNDDDDDLQDTAICRWDGVFTAGGGGQVFRLWSWWCAVVAARAVMKLVGAGLHQRLRVRDTVNVRSQM